MPFLPRDWVRRCHHHCAQGVSGFLSLRQALSLLHGVLLLSEPKDGRGRGFCCEKSSTESSGTILFFRKTGKIDPCASAGALGQAVSSNPCKLNSSFGSELSPAPEVKHENREQRSQQPRAAGLGAFTPEQVFYSSLECSGAFPEPCIP